jgi:hypothetical protein
MVGIDELGECTQWYRTAPWLTGVQDASNNNVLRSEVNRKVPWNGKTCPCLTSTMHVVPQSWMGVRDGVQL